MTIKTVRFLDGTFKLRGKEVDMTNQVLPIVQEYKVGVRGGYVSVDGKAVPGFPDRAIKVYVEGPDSIEPVDMEGPAVDDTESDEQVMERMGERFMMLTEMTKAVKRGDVRALIVSGPPGVGKSHGIEEVLERHSLVQSLGGAVKYETVKGAVSPLGLYCKLYQLAAKDNVIVFDDCDTIFTDETSLNLLKAALDTKKTRTLHWNSDSNKLRAENIPDSFKFEGSAIFVTNVKFSKVRGRLREHLAALESRCHYIDLTIDTDREKMLLIKKITAEGEMLRAHRLSDDTIADIIEFVDLNKTRLRELSLRTVLKVADLAKAFPTMWEAMAENTVMRRG
jgi:hypothetical protein